MIPLNNRRNERLGVEAEDDPKGMRIILRVHYSLDAHLVGTQSEEIIESYEKP